MNLKDITAPKGANRSRKRIGRGHGSGSGKTAGKGHKGQKARSGGYVRPGFEGGQMPLQRRLPKFGFTNIFRKQWAEISLSSLNDIEGDVIDTEMLADLGMVKAAHDGVKILSNGEISRAVTVRVEKITKSAKEKIEAAGGTVELIEPTVRPFEVEVSKIEKLADSVIDMDVLKKAGLVAEDVQRVRLVKRGAIKSAKTIRLPFVSRSARKAVLAVGGKIEEIG